MIPRTCKRGHLIDGHNALKNGTGKYVCRTCRYTQKAERETGPFECPSCGQMRKQRRYPLASTCRWCRWDHRRIHTDGYVDIWEPEHPLARKDGYVSEHRKVLHDAGVDVPSDAHVHHINRDKQDNRLENLAVLTPKQHTGEHLPVGAAVRNQYGEFPRWRT